MEPPTGDPRPVLAPEEAPAPVTLEPPELTPWEALGVSERSPRLPAAQPPPWSRPAAAGEAVPWDAPAPYAMPELDALAADDPYDAHAPLADDLVTPPPAEAASNPPAEAASSRPPDPVLWPPVPTAFSTAGRPAEPESAPTEPESAPAGPQPAAPWDTPTEQTPAGADDQSPWDLWQPPPEPAVPPSTGRDFRDDDSGEPWYLRTTQRHELRPGALDEPSALTGAAVIVVALLLIGLVIGLLVAFTSTFG